MKVNKRQDGIHGIVPRKKIVRAPEKRERFYELKPNAGIYQEFGFYSLDRWKKGHINEDTDLAQLFGYDEPGRFDLRGLGCGRILPHI